MAFWVVDRWEAAAHRWHRLRRALRAAAGYRLRAAVCHLGLFFSVALSSSSVSCSSSRVQPAREARVAQEGGQTTVEQDVGPGPLVHPSDC